MAEDKLLVAEVQTLGRLFTIRRALMYSLAGGLYDLEIRSGTHPAIPRFRCNLRQLIALRDDLTREIEEATKGPTP